MFFTMGNLPLFTRFFDDYLRVKKSDVISAISDTDSYELRPNVLFFGEGYGT